MAYITTARPDLGHQCWRGRGGLGAGGGCLQRRHRLEDELRQLGELAVASTGAGPPATGGAEELAGMLPGLTKGEAVGEVAAAGSQGWSIHDTFVTRPPMQSEDP
jgi:hypothetical protein